MFARLFAARREKRLAFSLYRKLAQQSRHPAFYTALGVPDTMDGRFDMILLHLFLITHRLEADGAETASLRRQVQETMVSDIDRALREAGVGDMSVGKEMKKIGSAWFGRVNAYTAAMQAETPAVSLAAALGRNIYRDEVPANQAFADKLAAYCLRARDLLAGYSLGAIEALSFEFPAPMPEERA